jgi:diacylglycerol kinase (ATP)
MKTLVIVNPIAGRGHAGRMIPKIEENLTGLGLAFDLVRTERPWHAAELAEQAARDGYDLVATASGDGTANETLNGLMRARADGYDRTALSILPVGTGNDFAYGMGMRGDLDTACRALVEGRRFQMDVGRVIGGDYPEGRYFGNGVGVGFDAAVGFEAAKIRWLRGLPAYLIAALRTIFIYFRAPTVEITYGEESFTQTSLLVSVMNGQRLGGGFFTAPDGLPDDGLLDLCIASAPGKLRTFQLLLHVMKGTQATQPEFRIGRTPGIRVRALQGTLPAHCDGETLCYAGEELRIELIPGAIPFLTQA